MLVREEGSSTTCRLDAEDEVLMHALRVNDDELRAGLEVVDVAEDEVWPKRVLSCVDDGVAGSGVVVCDDIALFYEEEH